MKKKDIYKIMLNIMEKLGDFWFGLLALLLLWLTSRDYMNVPAMKIVNASKLQLMVSAHDGNIIEVESAGLLVCWVVGLLVCWAAGLLGCGSAGLLVC